MFINPLEILEQRINRAIKLASKMDNEAYSEEMIAIDKEVVAIKNQYYSLLASFMFRKTNRTKELQS